MRKKNKISKVPTKGVGKKREIKNQGVIKWQNQTN